MTSSIAVRNMPPSSKKKNQNVLEQLNLLREFVGISSFSETDLTSCLRHTGYDVAMAAELLLTGQYRQLSSRVTSSNGSRKTSFFAAKSSQGFKNGSVAPTHNIQPKVQPTSTRKPSASAAVKPSKPRTVATTTAASSLSSNATPLKSLKENRSNQKFSSAIDLTSCGNSTVLAGAANEEPIHKLLLCRRWVSDWVITSRHGRVDHMDVLELEYSKQQQDSHRLSFRGPHGMEGRVPLALAQLLTPLLRLGVLQVQAQSLVGTTQPVWGGNLPVDVTVYLTQPRRFFDCMMTDNATIETKTSQYFQQKTEESTRRGRSTKKSLSVKEAAFLLLQWAEYGDVPDFSVPENNKTTDETEDQKPAAMSTPDDNDDDKVEVVELDNETLEEAASAEGQALEGSVVNNNSAATHADLPEMEDPLGFADHVTLRPYQKQALHFMINRESAGESREEVELQLQLLQELSMAEQKKQNNNVGSASLARDGLALQTKEIMCDIGPVMVNEQGQKKSMTLDGEVNPVNHPLWKRRFLAEPDLSRTFCFYVNELLGMATHPVSLSLTFLWSMNATRG